MQLYIGVLVLGAGALLVVLGVKTRWPQLLTVIKGPGAAGSASGTTAGAGHTAPAAGPAAGTSGVTYA